MTNPAPAPVSTIPHPQLSFARLILQARKPRITAGDAVAAMAAIATGMLCFLDPAHYLQWSLICGFQVVAHLYSRISRRLSALADVIELLNSKPK